MGMADRKQIKIWISTDAKGAIETMAERDGMTQEGVVSRVLLWFSSQPEIVQRAILGQLPKELTPDLVEIILRQRKKK